MADDPQEIEQDSQADLQIEEVVVGADWTDDQKEKAIRFQSIYSGLGLALGGLVILAGLVLIFLGISGSVEIGFQGGGTKGHIATGSLGVVVALFGLGIIYLTRYIVKSAKGNT
jgi:hypothetical protein